MELSLFCQVVITTKRKPAENLASKIFYQPKSFNPRYLVSEDFAHTIPLEPFHCWYL